MSAALNLVQSEPIVSARPHLSYSGMKDLWVSPMRFWWRHLRADRETEEPTPAMKFGSALHCKVLRPDDFEKEYCASFQAPDEALTSADDIRRFIRAKGETPRGTLKASLIEQARALAPSVLIADELEASYYAAHKDKTVLSAETMDRVNRCADAVLACDAVRTALQGAKREAWIERDIDGVLLAGSIDAMGEKVNLDLKTFTVPHGKTVERAVVDAIWYERYHWQAYVYALMRATETKAWRGSHMLVFVESEEPYEVRIRTLRDLNYGQPSMCWHRARVECDALIGLFRSCYERWGTEPWTDNATPQPLLDEDIPQLGYGG